VNRSERRQGERLSRDLAHGVKDFGGRDVAQQTFTYLQALDVLSAQALEHSQAARFKTEQMRTATSQERMRLMGEIQSHLLNSNEALTQCMRMQIEQQMATLNMPVRMQVHGDIGKFASERAESTPEACPVKHEMLNPGSECPQCGAQVGDAAQG
jgi:hypothetical protein